MTGILEQIAADVTAIKAMLANAAPVAAAAQPQAFAPPQVAFTPPPPPPPQTPPSAYPAATAEMITALITPHVENPALKAQLQQQMAAMGIGALPDAQPHQYGELYARFQHVIASFAAPVAQPAATPASII